MPRKNSRVRRSNDKGRLARRDDAGGLARKASQPRVKIEDLVMPDGQCHFQSSIKRPKARFATIENASRALEQAQQQRARAGSAHVEKRYYACPEGGCGGYHLTSRETFDEKVWKQRRDQRETNQGV